MSSFSGIISESSSGADSKYTIDEILDRAESFIEEYNYEMGQKFCQRALEMDADNVRALEICASLLLEVSSSESCCWIIPGASFLDPILLTTISIKFYSMLKFDQSHQSRDHFKLCDWPIL